MLRNSRCPECADGLFEKNGKCGHCNGTGVNTQLNSAEPDCPYCRGGVCAACGGTGVTSDLIQKLFD